MQLPEKFGRGKHGKRRVRVTWHVPCDNCVHPRGGGACVLNRIFVILECKRMGCLKHRMIDRADTDRGEE